MITAPTPVAKDLVLVGAGHSHVKVLKAFGMRPAPGVRLTLITRELHAPYSGMLPGLIAGHYAFDEAHIDTGPLARFAGARLIHDRAIGLDLERRLVICAGRPPVAFDLVSLDIGATPELGIRGATEGITPVKPIDAFYARWRAIEARIVAAHGKYRLALVGGGAGGVELALAIRHRMHRLLDASAGVDSPEIVLVSRSPRVLPQFNEGTRIRFERILPEHDIRVLTAVAVQEAKQGVLVLSDGRELACDDALWTTQAGAAAWLHETGLALDPDGFVRVDATLRSTSHPLVFAAGDVASVDGQPRPKSGVFAVRQGPVLADNLRRALAGRKLRAFRPQRDFLSLISTGDRYAVASRGAWSGEGAWVWRWKDWIDRRWMRGYNDLPAMQADTAPAATADGTPASRMRCAGCGAKVGSEILERALRDITVPPQTGILLGLDAPDDAAVIAIPPDRVAVQSVDYFPAFVDDPYVFGQIAANHALGDLFAMGAEPHSALAIVALPYATEAKMEQDLRALLAGANETLAAAGAALVGGHTSEGDQLGLGFAVTGLADPARILTKGGMRAGDRLILTKPIGTGVLLAADAQRQAKARWVDAALVSMRQSNREGALWLQRHGATAMTDVTGFGLLGHLLEMARASSKDLSLDLKSLPVLDGALDLTVRGIRSSLYPQNAKAGRAIRNLEAAERHPVFALLFDPQTAGGLLASLPAEAVEPCIDALRRAGYTSAIEIGHVVGDAEATGPGILVTGVR